MAVTRSDTIGFGVVGHVAEELRPSFVTATILGQQTEGKAAGDWAQLENHRVVTHKSVQEKVS